jgi:hypothetical protein
LPGTTEATAYQKRFSEIARWHETLALLAFSSHRLDESLSSTAECLISEIVDASSVVSEMWEGEAVGGEKGFMLREILGLCLLKHA